MEFLHGIERTAADLVVSKSTCDSFYRTDLQSVLSNADVRELLICGWATDYCVDTTVRAAASREYSITIVADGHTAASRPHLDAATIIRHHNITWADLLVPAEPIRILTADEIARQRFGQPGDAR